MKCIKAVFGVMNVVALVTTAACLPASAEIFGQYGAVTTVTPGPGTDPAGFQLTSDPAGAGYAGLYWTAQPGTPLSAITNLLADYQMTIGTFGGGAPRFSISDTTNNVANEAYVYWGTPQGGGGFTDPAAGSASNTGNLADLTSADLRVQVNGFGGDSTGASYETWAAFVANDGADDVSYVSLDLDGGFSSPGQQALVDNFTVNSDVDIAPTPEPGTLAMFGLGSALLLATLRRKRATDSEAKIAA